METSSLYAAFALSLSLSCMHTIPSDDTPRNTFHVERSMDLEDPRNRKGYCLQSGIRLTRKDQVTVGRVDFF